MSLITDTNFLIHRLRLQYLRDVEDPYGARVISLDPSYQTNPYIVAANLADVDRWPELAAPSSPPISEDEGERPSGFPGARGLRYTQTIMGHKSGGLGLRVNGKRMSTSKRMSGTPRQDDLQKGFAPENPAAADVLTNAPPISGGTLSKKDDDTWLKITEPSPTAETSPQPPKDMPPAPAAEPPPKVVQFIPKFKGAAEMEARRRVRMMARRGPGGAPPPRAAPAATLDFSSSSDEDVAIAADDSDSDVDSDFGVPAVNTSIDEEDEFDPDFATTRTPGANSNSPSDGASINSYVSLSQSSVPIVGSVPQQVSRPRLSPVLEKRGESSTGGPPPVPPRLRPKASTASLDPNAAPPARTRSDGSRTRTTAAPGAIQTPTSPPAPPVADTLFARRPVAAIQPQKSALSAMLASSGGSSNPFAELYAAISGRAESAAVNLQVYFPHAKEPAGKPMHLSVRRDATVEEVVGFALWNYWEEGWLPKLDEGLSGEDDPKWATKLSAVGWLLRMAEDDGEVDDDFPPPDRSGKIVKFQDADAFAILEASTAQVEQNKELEAKIQRHPSRMTASRKPDKSTLAAPGALTVPNLAGLGASSAFGSALGSFPLSTSLGPSTHGPQIFLRIRVADTADAVHISTTINVSAGMYMQEALELVCRKRKLMNPKEYALLVADKSIVIPLDRTVASLQGVRELVLMKKSALPQLGDVVKAGRSTDPNASIFKRMSDVPDPQFTTASEISAAYKKYTIYRKHPMLIARQERTLAIDGVYLHVSTISII
ncbi:hypothetical protein HGRIS_000449 [Hohenbuehelia grisea]|uniref:Sin1 middle CRIM domain-containing protein n=1 Tax=Hohenbuehelia grisea TaxID=104357 RepID=A0ABR3JT28_9AGAR